MLNVKAFIAAAAAASAAAGAAAAVKDKKFCPLCAVKKLTGALKVHPLETDLYSNGTALTPPMGWSSWNLFRNHINEVLIYEIAEAMKNSGLADCGYKYVNLDDCWQSSVRDKDGRLQGDLTNFRSGIPALVKKVNALGLKLGIYASNGTLTCEDLPSCYGSEALDAQTFAEWGVEYFKYDYCHNVPIPTAAPQIDKILIGKAGGPVLVTLQAEKGELRGLARVVEDKRLDSGKYVTGLSSGAGQIVFYDVELPEDGEYVVTVVVRKFGTWRKHLEISANGEKAVSADAPSTISRTVDGRVQATVDLRAGKNSLMLFNPITSRFDSSARQYSEMGRLLKEATAKVAEETGEPEKPICYSICEWGMNLPWKWAMKAGNLWRTSLDIFPNWASIVANYEQCVIHPDAAGPGNWNDPDMLEVGNGELTETENKAHFSLWCMMASPLILGNDVRTFVDADGSPKKDDPVLKILTNKELIAIDQDPLGMQCRRFRTNGVTDVLVKKLASGKVAVCFFNKLGKETKMSCRLNDVYSKPYVNLPVTDGFGVRDVWGGTEFTVENELSATVPAHGVRVFVCSQD
ncbi:MAG: hypothetical protein K6C36_00940 [Clostridia bacterium]|nr:hypothetical protein [Clostridia bacterium]